MLLYLLMQTYCRSLRGALHTLHLSVIRSVVVLQNLRKTLLEFEVKDKLEADASKGTLQASGVELVFTESSHVTQFTDTR